MDQWRTRTENWLSNEHHGLDDAADEAFAHVFAALPAVEPSADFVQRAVGAARLAHVRRRRMIVAAGLAASVGMVTIAGVTAYGVVGLAGGWLLTRMAAAVTGSTVGLLMTATTAVEWWSTTARAGSMVAGVVVMPQGAAMLLAIELVGAAALYTLRRLLKADLTFRNPGPLCV